MSNRRSYALIGPMVEMERRAGAISPARLGRHGRWPSRASGEICRSGALRNLNRAIDRLERLQRRRQGEAVPPP